MSASEGLSLIDLSVDYPQKPEVLKHLSLEVGPGEIVGLAGQSGSGKSTLALAIFQLLALKGGQARGAVRFEGRELHKMKERDLRDLRGRRMALILQSPSAALNPVLRIGTQLREAWKAHASGNDKQRVDAILAALENANLSDGHLLLRRRTSEISVGQAQRVLIAMATLHHPSLLIADEATSALDVITQAQILLLFAKLNRERGMSILYISHDLMSVASLCHRIAILHRGEIVECGSTRQIFEDPRHVYTRQLVEALPKNSFRSPTFAKHPVRSAKEHEIDEQKLAVLRAR